MLKTSFLAPTFRGFWRQWNPLWSYYLTYYLYQPVNRILPQAMAIVITFSVSGLLHDLVATMLTQKIVLFLTPVFSLFGVLVVLEKLVKLNLGRLPGYLKALYHTGLISICTLLVYYLKFGA